jgi:hypothetical protein
MAQVSPDGKWLAYQSNESGRFEIYVQPFPGPGEKIRVSESRGTHARWRRDGKELFCIALDGQLISVPIRLTGNEQTNGCPFQSSVRLYLKVWSNPLGLQKLLLWVPQPSGFEGKKSERHTGIERRRYPIAPVAETLSRAIPDPDCGRARIRQRQVSATSTTDGSISAAHEYRVHRLVPRLWRRCC